MADQYPAISAGLERGPGLHSDLVQSAVVEQSPAVQGHRIGFICDVGGNPLSDHWSMGDGQLNLIDQDRLSNGSLQ